MRYQFWNCYNSIVLPPSWCLLVPRKRREVLSVGTGPRRASLQFSRLKTQSTLYRSPNSPQGGFRTKLKTAFSPTLPLVSSATLTSPWFACNGFHLSKYSPLSSSHWGSKSFLSISPGFQKPKMRQAVALWMPGNFSSWPVTPKSLS